MMQLSLMQAIVATLTDAGESPLAEQILAAWPHDRGSARFFRVSANALFTFTSAQQPFFLRFNHERERSAAQVSAEIAYLQHLAAAGIRVARPVPSLAGRSLESIETALGRFHAVVFEAVAGQQHELDALTTDMFSQWGQALGRLHAAAQTFVGAGRPSWHDHFTGLMHSVPPHEAAVHAAIAKLRGQLAALPATPHSFGLIHFDFELDNLIWAEDGVAAIDFDDSAWYWFAADIAFALRDLFGDDLALVDLGSAPFQAFIAGYRREMPIAQEEIQHIPLFLRAHHVILFARLLRALGTHPPSDEPAWLGELRATIERKLQAYRDECTTL